MDNLPQAIDEALQAIFEWLPNHQAMSSLVVAQPPQTAAIDTVETVLQHDALARRPALQAAVWLYADDLDRSHKICQAIDDATGSYWHGIMHRREGDFPNSHHWFRKVGDHPAIALIGYDPHAFIDAVEQRHNEAAEDLVALQRREWETLFSWCATQYDQD